MIRKSRKRYHGISDSEEQSIRLFHLAQDDFPGLSFEYKVLQPGSTVSAKTVIDNRGKLRLDQNDGTKVPAAQLGDGVADSTKFLRGDQVWASVPGGGSGKIEIKDEGTVKVPEAHTLDFVGPGVEAIQDNVDPFTAIIKVLHLLSALQIDADKDWLGRIIYNIGALTLDSEIGDLYAVCLDVQGNKRIVRIPAGPKNYVLTSQGPGKCPIWAPMQEPLKFHYVLPLGFSYSTKSVTIDVISNGQSDILSDYGAEGVIHPEWYYRIEREFTTDVATEEVSTDITVDSEADFAMILLNGVNVLVDGAVVDDGGVMTDETTAARNTTSNDMTLLPTNPEVDDAYYFGAQSPFKGLRVDLGTIGVGVWDLHWEYFNGTTWEDLNADEWNHDDWRLKLGDYSFIWWTKPGDWQTKEIKGMNLYWVRARVVSFTQATQIPKGSQAWVLT